MLCCMDWWICWFLAAKQSNPIPLLLNPRSHLWAPTWIDPSFQMYLIDPYYVFLQGEGIMQKSWHWFCSKAPVGPRHYWVLFWRYGQSTNSWTHQGLYHLMGTAVRYGRPYSFYASWIWMQGTHFVFSVFSFCFRLHSKAGRSSSWCCFFSLCGNLGVARPPYKGECQGTHVAMPKTNVRNGQRATFQRRFFLWNKLYLIVYD